MHETQAQRGLVPPPRSHSSQASQAWVLSASASRLSCVEHLSTLPVLSGRGSNPVILCDGLESTVKLF